MQEDLEAKATQLREHGAERVISIRSNRQIQKDSEDADKLDSLTEEIDIAAANF